MQEMTGSAVWALGQRAGLGRGQMGKGRLRKENSGKNCGLRTFLHFLKRIQEKKNQKHSPGFSSEPFMPLFLASVPGLIKPALAASSMFLFQNLKLSFKKEEE